MHFIRTSNLLLFFIFSCTLSFSQSKSSKIFPFGAIEEIQSEALSEKRILNIYLPDGYHPDSLAVYPVVYVLDGSYNEDFPHLAGLVQFLNMYAILPKSIVVGIGNIDRYRDFTHPSDSKADKESLPTGGGSTKFIQFIEQELEPFVGKNYKTNGHKTIIGQSLGGLLATEILFTKPALFDDYIIVSPSLWWGDGKLLASAPNALKSLPNPPKKVFVAVGKEHPEMVKSAKKLWDDLKKYTEPQHQTFYEYFPKEDHATILHRGVYRAFELFYQVEEKK